MLTVKYQENKECYVESSFKYGDRPSRTGKQGCSPITLCHTLTFKRLRIINRAVTHAVGVILSIIWHIWPPPPQFGSVEDYYSSKFTVLDLPPTAPICELWEGGGSKTLNYVKKYFGLPQQHVPERFSLITPSSLKDQVFVWGGGVSCWTLCK